VRASLRAWGLLGETANRRALGWRRLAEAFYLPDGAWVQALVAGQIEKDLAHSVAWLDSDRELFDEPLGTLGRFREAQVGLPAAVVQEALEVEYARLFIGPARELPAQPYESVWLDVDPQSGLQLFGAASTKAVEAVYAHHGLVRAASYHDLADHIATEQEFLCYLCEREAAAWSSGGSESAKGFRAAEQDFLVAHLGKFGPQFCTSVVQAAPDGAYAAFAAFLLAFLTVESGTPYVKVVSSIWPTAER
jgi:TorA maturation chaperone TorD